MPVQKGSESPEVWPVENFREQVNSLGQAVRKPLKGCSAGSPEKPRKLGRKRCSPLKSPGSEMTSLQPKR